MTTNTAVLNTSDFVAVREVGAPVDRLRDVIAQPQLWWSTRCEWEGDEFTVRFGENWTRVRVSDEGARWTVTAMDTPALSVPDEWVGDELSLVAEPNGVGGSVLRFVHHGLRAQDCADICTGHWPRFVDSLVDVAEGGAGAPESREDSIA